MLETRRWELSGNLQLGLGSAHVLYRNLDGSSSKTPREFMVVTEPSISAHLRVSRWVGIGAGGVGGFRRIAPRGVALVSYHAVHTCPRLPESPLPRLGRHP